MAESATCHFCKTGPARYTCPRCQALYCTLKCYQSPQHVSCSEDFYKDCVFGEMEARGIKSSDKSGKQRMEEILRKMQSDEAVSDEQLDSDDTESEEDLAERLKGVNLDSAEAIWERLTDSERQDFQNLVQSGEIEKLIPAFEPWWTIQPSLVEEINTLSETRKIPVVKEEIPLLSSVTKKRPADSVFFNLLNILYGYACAVRLYGLEWDPQSPDVARVILKVSDCLVRGTNYTSPTEALDSAQLTAMTDPDVKLSVELSETVKKDVALIVKGPTPSRRSEYALAALSEIHHILSSSVKKKLQVSSKDIKLAIKKVEFYLSLVKEFGTG